MDIYAQIAEKIIEHQETIIGPVAIEQAKKVSGMTVDWGNHVITISGDQKTALDELVEQYKNLFGQISVEVSREAAAKPLAELTLEQRPESLR